MNFRHKVLLGGVIALAVFFRFFQITVMPGGLFPDEAANGLDINMMQQGQLQPFYERGNGREALFFYLLWGSVELLGKGPWQHHIISSLIGVLTVIVTFFLTRRLFLLNGNNAGNDSDQNYKATRIALLAAFLTAVSSWYVVLSRTAFRANLIPLFAALTFYLLIATYQAVSSKKRLLLGFLTGVSFAAGFYTYIAYRIMVPVVGILIFWPFVVDLFSHPRLEGVKKFWKPALLFLIGFAVVIYPLFKYFYDHPGSFIGRSGQVSVFNQTLYTFDGKELLTEPSMGEALMVMGEVAKRSVAAYFVDGDLNWRHNISGQPFLSPLVSPFFGIALVLITLMAAGYILMPRRRAGWWKYTLLAGWFWAMLLPVVTTAEGIPHGLRAIGTIPVIFIMAAWGLYEFWQLVMRLHNRIYENWAPERIWLLGLVKKGFTLVIVCFVGALVLQTYFLYFVYAANSPENFYAFRSDLTPVSKYLISYGNKDDTYLVLDKFSVQTPDYITTVDGRNPDSPRNRPYVQVDPENAWELSGLKPGDKIVFTQSSMFDAKKFKEHHSNARLEMEVRNKFGQAVMAVYRVTD